MALDRDAMGEEAEAADTGRQASAPRRHRRVTSGSSSQAASRSAKHGKRKNPHAHGGMHQRRNKRPNW
jgi:hypothetical protein